MCELGKRAVLHWIRSVKTPTAFFHREAILHLGLKQNPPVPLKTAHPTAISGWICIIQSNMQYKALAMASSVTTHSSPQPSYFTPAFIPYHPLCKFLCYLHFFYFVFLSLADICPWVMMTDKFSLIVTTRTSRKFHICPLCSPGCTGWPLWLMVSTQNKSPRKNTSAKQAASVLPKNRTFVYLKASSKSKKAKAREFI